MQLVETIEVGAGGAASIEFTSIPQDADDLLLVLSLRSAGSGTSIGIEINGDSAYLNYSWKRLNANGTTATSSSASGQNQLGFHGISNTSYTANTFGSGMAYFPNYKASVAKSASIDAVSENNATLALSSLGAGLWNDTAAITSLLIRDTGNNLAQYSTASLYKITKA